MIDVNDLEPDDRDDRIDADRDAREEARRDAYEAPTERFGQGSCRTGRCVEPCGNDGGCNR